MKLRKRCIHNKRISCLGCPQMDRCLKLNMNNGKRIKIKLTNEGIKTKHKGDRYYKL